MLLFATAYFTQFIVAASLGVVFGYLADLQDRYDLSDASLGIIAATAFAAALLTQLFLAPFIDRGVAGGVATLALTATVLGSFGFVFAEQTWTLAASRGLTGVGFGLFSIVARKAIIGVDITGGAKKVGLLLSFGVAGFLSGPAIGASLGLVSFEMPFIVMGAVLLAVTPLMAVQIGRAPLAIAKVDYSHFAELLRRPKIQAALGGQIALWGFVGLFDSTVDRYLTDLGLSSLQIAVGLLVIGIPLILLPPKIGALGERVGGVAMFVPAYLALVPAIWIYGFVTGLAIFIVIGVVESIVESYAAMSSQVLVLEATGAERVAVGTALLEAVGLLAALFAALVGPIGYSSLGQYRLFGLWALCSAVPVLLSVLRLRFAKPGVAKPGVEASSA